MWFLLSLRKAKKKKTWFGLVHGVLWRLPRRRFSLASARVQVRATGRYGYAALRDLVMTEQSVVSAGYSLIFLFFSPCFVLFWLGLLMGIWSPFLLIPSSYRVAGEENGLLRAHGFCDF